MSPHYMQGAFDCFRFISSYLTSRAPARKVTALNPAPEKTPKVDPKKSQEELQSWGHSLSGQMVESSDQQNHPFTHVTAVETPTPLNIVTPDFCLTPLVEPVLSGTGTVCQETSKLEENHAVQPDHSAQAQGATTISNSPEKGAGGVYSAPISASVRDIVASKEEQGLMISGLEEVKWSSSIFMLIT